MKGQADLIKFPERRTELPVALVGKASRLCNISTRYHEDMYLSKTPLTAQLKNGYFWTCFLIITRCFLKWRGN